MNRHPTKFLFREFSTRIEVIASLALGAFRQWSAEPLMGETHIITNYVGQRQHNRIDTIYKERTDTITQVVEVERPLKFREKVMMNIGGFAMVILVILIGFGIMKFTRKL